MIFICAQPDVPYFHWQIRMLFFNFEKFGIIKKCRAIFGLMNGAQEPSDGLKKLLRDYPDNIHFYKDTRLNRSYIPSIKPHLVKHYLKEHPQDGKCLFLTDSDILFRQLPNFGSMLFDDISYVSECPGYIDYNYIKGCCDRYKAVHSNLGDIELLEDMADKVGVSVDLIKQNNDKSRGAQYLIKDTDYHFWHKVDLDCNRIYDTTKKFGDKYPIPAHIQFWTAEMWAILWNMWYFEKETALHPELAFSWATDPVSRYEERNIFHLAGILDEMKKEKFYKGEFINKCPFTEYKNNPEKFQNYSPNFGAIKYVEEIKRFVESKRPY